MRVTLLGTSDQASLGVVAGARGKASRRNALTGVLIVAACVASSGCITGFAHPLGSVKGGFIEPGLVGTWTCRAADDSKPVQLTILDFDARQYYIESVERPEGRPDRMRGFATRLNEVPFLSAREIGSDSDGEWSFLTYALPDADHLALRVVDPEPFEDVVEDPAGVRERLATFLEDPEVIRDFLSCVRVRVVPAKS